ncbi:odorant receptor 22c-like [Hylaeus anthracinus]|uniref:odorant receptor 22c-like n=1 Tax=Hylaeus anthracinus TaxID=313031 RepID=UPI0023B97FAB|nr:odorant receptor 22c-like [Hylaeus anthracinus]
MLSPVTTLTKGHIIEHDLEKYVDLSIQWSRWLLKPYGMWPNLSDTTRIDKYFSWILIVICCIIMSFFCVPCTLYIFLDAEDVYDRIKHLGPLTFCVTAYMKFYAVIARGDDIRECIECIERDWFNIKYSEDRNIMIAKANYGKRISKICALFMYSGAAFYYILIPIKVGKIEIEGENTTFIPIAMPFPRQIFDTRYSPINEIVFVIQVLGGFLMHAVSAGVCSLIATFALHICGQMEILSSWLEHLVDGRSDMCKTVDGRIGSIVNQHVRIIKYLSLLEKTMSRISLIEVAGRTLDMCLVGYYVIMEWHSKNMTATVTYTIIFTSVLFNIFIFCYIGELVDEQCAMIGETSYMIEWHRLPKRKQLSMILIIAMSNAASKLTAGSVIMLSLDSFSSVVKTAFAFLNMLRTVAVA